MEISFKKIFKQKKFFLLFLFSIVFIFSTIDLNAHPAKKHKPMVCILEEDRTEAQKRTCRQWLFIHRLCKLDQDCAILRLEAAKKEIQNLEDQLGGVAECGDIPFNHKAAKNTKVYQKPESKSQVIAKVKKGDELLFYAPSSKDENWYYVKVKKDNSCADGYVKAQFVVKKEEATEDVVVEVKKAELIKIIKPKLQKNGKLMIIDAEGTLSITGAVTEDKVDEILINEEEETINDDNTFTYLLFVPSEGAEIRIIGKKNEKKVKELSFKIRVGK